MFINLPNVTAKYDLIFRVKPIECQVHDSNWLPMVWDFFAGTIYNMRYLVSDNELQIL